MSTAGDLTPEEVVAYKAAARQRYEQEQASVAQRSERAWELARRAATLLRAEYGVGRVVVFGSLIREGSFGLQSDVDIAAWDIKPADTLRAMGAVLDLDAEIEVNLVDVGACKPSVLTAIKKEGVDL